MGGHIYAHEKQKNPPLTPHFQISDLGQRLQAAVEAGGGIQANAHPEFSQPTPLDKTVAAVKGLFKKKAK